MKSQYYDKMTKDMKDIYDETFNEEELKKEFIRCNEMYERAKKAGNINLPAVNEDGVNIVHGCRREMDEIEKFWLIRRDRIKRHLPREWVEEQGVCSMSYVC